MAPHHVRQMVKRLKEVGSRIYRGLEASPDDGATIQDAADVILEFLAADDDRAKAEAYVRGGRVPLAALFQRDDILVMQGAAALWNPSGNDEAAVADALAEIVGEWLSERMEGYVDPQVQAEAEGGGSDG